MKWSFLLMMYAWPLFSAARLPRVTNLFDQLAFYAKRLARVPGYTNLIKIIKAHEKSSNSAGIESALFELRTATVLQDQGHTVRGLGVIPNCAPKCEIDVQTNVLCVECKTGRCQDIARHCLQFKKQRNVARRLGLEYAIYFKQPPPSDLNAWLVRNKIPCVVLPDPV